MMERMHRKIERRDTSDRRFIGNSAGHADSGMRRGKRRGGERRDSSVMNWLGGGEIFPSSWFMSKGYFRPR